jgi:hypothetical protein
VRASVVLRKDLNVLVTVAPLELVLDAEIGEVDVVVEVRKVVVAGPFLDFSRVPIGSTIAVGAVAVAFVQKTLVLPLEIVLEDHATDLRALLSETFLGAQVGTIERGVVRQLARPEDAGTERLASFVVPFTAV